MPAPLSWKAPTHEYTERSPDWFWALGLLSLAGAGISIFFSNVLLAVIIGLGAVCFALLALKPPKLCTITITNEGVQVEEALYPLRSLISFWIDEVSRETPQLIIGTRSFLNPVLVLPLEPHVSIEELREHMLTLIPEEEQYESMFSHLASFFGF